jgi:hypothetical protein
LTTKKNSSNEEGRVYESEKTANGSLRAEDPAPLHVGDHGPPSRNPTEEEEEEEERSPKYIKGWKLHMLTLGYDFVQTKSQVE